jgi:hypothetical protein
VLCCTADVADGSCAAAPPSIFCGSWNPKKQTRIGGPSTLGGAIMRRMKVEEIAKQALAAILNPKVPPDNSKRTSRDGKGGLRSSSDRPGVLDPLKAPVGPPLSYAFPEIMHWVAGCSRSRSAVFDVGPTSRRTRRRINEPVRPPRPRKLPRASPPACQLRANNGLSHRRKTARTAPKDVTDQPIGA